MVLNQGITTWPLQSALLRLLPLCGWSRARGHHALGKQSPGLSCHHLYCQHLPPIVCDPFSNQSLQVLRLEAQQRKKERQAARKAEEKRLEEEEVDATIVIIYSPIQSSKEIISNMYFFNSCFLNTHVPILYFPLLIYHWHPG